MKITLLTLWTVLMASGHGVLAVSDETPERIISTDAAATEILLLLGAADRLVGVDTSSRLPQGHELPRLGYHRALAVEGLLGLDPDLVIGAETMGPVHVVDHLKRSGTRLLTLPAAGNIPQLQENIQQLAGVVIAQPQQADELVQLIADTAHSIHDRKLAGLTGAFLLRGEGGKLRLAGDNTAGAGFIDVLGLTNTANYRAYRSITSEGLLELDPDVLILADTGGNDADDLLKHFPLLRFSRAVSEDQLFTVNPETLVAGLSPSALNEAARILREHHQMLAGR